ncbi:MAG: DNA polymerase IV [Bacteroidota bacterium]
MSERAIVHLDLDTFFVSVERRKDKRLQGKAIIVGGTGDRGVVAACSYEARRFGIRAGMPLRTARQLCPEAIFMGGDYDAYQQESAIITEIIAEKAPLYEKASVDEFYIDMTGMERFFGCYQWAGELRDSIIRETALPLSLGLSVNKLVSKVATGEAKPNGQLQIDGPAVSDFLAPMKVRKIPMIGRKTALQLNYLGVRTVRRLREIPEPILGRVFGRHGKLLYQRARGEDDSPVVPYYEQKSLSTEQTFSQDTIDVDWLEARLVRMVEQLGFQLRKLHKLAACVTVKIRYTNFETLSRQTQISYTASDAILIEKARFLFHKLYQRRVSVRLLGVKLTKLVPGGSQIELFQSQARQLELYHSLDQLKLKHGGHILGRASGLTDSGEEEKRSRREGTRKILP